MLVEATVRGEGEHALTDINRIICWIDYDTNERFDERPEGREAFAVLELSERSAAVAAEMNSAMASSALERGQELRKASDEDRGDLGQ